MSSPATIGTTPAPAAGQRDWRVRAACADYDPELWFPIDGHAEQAVAICRGCPVRTMCADWAISTGAEYGIWGGLREEDRRRIRADMPVAAHAAPAGGPQAGRRGRIATVRRMAAAGMSDSTIAARFGVVRNAIYELRHRHNIPPGGPEQRKWTADELVELYRMATAGERDKDIAAALGRTSAAVRVRRHQDGIPTMHNRGRPI